MECAAYWNRYEIAADDEVCRRKSGGQFASINECLAANRYSVDNLEAGCRRVSGGDYNTRAACTQAAGNASIACYNGEKPKFWPPGPVPSGELLDRAKPCNITYTTPAHAATTSCCVLDDSYWRYSDVGGECVRTQDGLFNGKAACDYETRYSVDNKYDGCVRAPGGDYGSKAACTSAVGASRVAGCPDGAKLAFYPDGPVPTQLLFDETQPCNITYTTSAHKNSYGCCTKFIETPTSKPGEEFVTDDAGLRLLGTTATWAYTAYIK
jgi:hypothetical protein